MSGTTTVLVTILLTLFASPLVLPDSSPKLEIPELQVERVQAHWIDEGEPAPFDGILLNDYTYERLRLKLIDK